MWYNLHLLHAAPVTLHALLRQGWQEVPRKRTLVRAEYAEQPGADELGLRAGQQAPANKTPL